MPDLFPSIALSPLAEHIQRHLLFRRERGLPPIMNDELCEMMSASLRVIIGRNVDDRMIRAAVAELNKKGVMAFNHGAGYFISTDPRDADIQCDIYYSHLHAYAEKIADIKRATVASVFYDGWKKEEQIIQESLAATAEGLK